MTRTIWMVVFVNLFSGSTMWPHQSASSPTMSVYDICAKTDLHQIEELKNTLFEHLNSSTFQMNENISSVSFGLLDEDWERLLKLENRIPEGSVLKSKLLVVFRIIIAALNQAHGTTLEHIKEQDGDYVYDEEPNSIESEEYGSLDQLETGGSDVNYTYVKFDDGFSTRRSTTTFRNFVSEEVSDPRTSFGDSFEESSHSNHTVLKDSYDSSDLSQALSTQDENQNQVKPSNNEEQNDVVVNDPVLNLGDDFVIVPSLSPISELSVSQTSDVPKPESSVTNKPSPSGNKDVTETHDTTIHPVFIKDNEEKQIIGTTTNEMLENSTNEQKIDKEPSFDEYNLPVNHTKTTTYMTTSNSLDVATARPGVFLSNHEDISLSTKYRVDPIRGMYPELIEMFINQVKNSFTNNSEDRLNLSATTTDSWENNRIVEDLDGSDSSINEVVAQNIDSEYNVTEITDGIAVGENTDGVSDRALNLTNLPNKPNHHYSTPDFLNSYSSTSYTTVNNYKNLNTTNNGAYINPAHSNLIDTLEANRSTPGDDLTSGLTENDILTSTRTETSFSRPLDINPDIRENTQNFEKNFRNPIFDEKENDTQSSVKLNDFVLKNNDDGSRSEQSTAESSEYLFGNDHVQESNAETSVNIQTNNDSTSPAVQFVSKSSGDEDSRKLESSTAEINVFSPAKSDEANSGEQFVPKSLEHVTSLENDKFQSGSKEENDLSVGSSTSESPAVKPIPGNSEEVLSLEVDNLPSSRVETSTFIPGKTDEFITNKDKFNNSIIEESSLSVRNNTSETNAINTISQSSEYISSAENDNFQTSSIEQSGLIVKNSTKESSDEVVSVEKDTLPSSSVEMYMFTPTHNDELYVKSDSSERLSSSEKKNVQSSMDRDGLRSKEEGSETSAAKVSSEILEQMSLADSDEMHTTSKLISMGENFKKDEPTLSPYSEENNPDESNLHVAKSSEIFNNTDQLESYEDIPSPLKTSDEELDRPLPTQSTNELKIYPALAHPFKLSGYPSKEGCRNGNDCVHVKHIEYKVGDNAFSKTLSKRFYSKFKTKSEESSEIEEDASTYFLSPPEKLIWQEKVRDLKESVDY